MNDTDLNTVLDAIHADLRKSPAPPSLHERVGAIPLATPRQRGWLPRIDRGSLDMFSALKLVAAAVIVALFGGFLLAGVFTTQRDGEVLPAASSASPTTESDLHEVTAPPDPRPSPTTTEELLSGMVTEEVEPGVYRVVNDGERDLSSKNNQEVVAGHDGGIWLLRTNRFLRLSTPGGHEWATKKPKVCDFEVAPDGTVWMVQEPTAKAKPAIRSYDGRQWTTVFRTKEDCNVEIAPDGTVLADHTRRDEDGGFVAVVLRLDTDIEEFEVPPPEGADPFVAMDGEVWAADGWAVHGDRTFWRYGGLDGAWHHVATLPQPAYYTLFDGLVYGTPVDAVGTDGTIWYAYAEPLIVDGKLVLDEDGGLTLGESFLLRFDDSGWQRWGSADGVPPQSALVLTPAPDGTLWVRRNARWEPGADGVFRFDGATWRHHLPDHSIVSLDVGPDGSGWLLSGSGDLYVISPDAAAAAE